MKRTFSLAVAMAIVLTLSPFIAHQAKACDYSFSGFTAYCAPVTRVRAFTFQPVYTAQTTAYATYTPFTLQAAPPVVKQVPMPQPVAVQAPPPVSFYSPPAATFQSNHCPNTAAFFSAPSYSDVRFRSPVRSFRTVNRSTRVRAPFVSVDVDNGRFFRRGSFTAVRAPFTNVSFSNGRVFRGRSKSFTSFGNGTTVVTEVGSRGGPIRNFLFGRPTRTTVTGPGFQTTFRGRR